MRNMGEPVQMVLRVVAVRVRSAPFCCTIPPPVIVVSETPQMAIAKWVAAIIFADLV